MVVWLGPFVAVAVRLLMDGCVGGALFDCGYVAVDGWSCSWVGL
jgi:hypothetical protein